MLAPPAAPEFAETPCTPLRWLSLFPLLGLVTTDQLLPFQHSISLWSRLLPLRYEPTAVQELDETQATPFSWLSLVPLLGLGTIDQVDAAASTGPKNSAPADKPSPTATPTARSRN